MKTNGNLEHIRLINAKGKEIKGAIFNNVYELWNAEQTQLTLIFDPARVKTGLKAHKKLGRALQVGQAYKLIIKDLEDAEHQKLTNTFVKNLFIITEDRTAPHINNHWKLLPPKANTRDFFTLHFADIVDQMSLHNRLVVTNAQDKRIKGKITLGKHEKSWKFIPKKPWKPGDYTLYINTRLEDPAGNNLNGLFDHKKGSLKSNQEGETLHLKFRIE